MTNPIVFDIETGPRPRPEIKEFMPEFSAPSNWKDPDKIAAYCKAEEHKWMDQAALSAITGYIVAIGIHDGKEVRVFASGDERENIQSFWDAVTGPSNNLQCDLIGFNSNGFDIPFLARRSWRLGIKPPFNLLNGRWLNNRCIDLMDLWRCGNTRDSISLDNLSKYLGIGEKTGHGKFFAEIYAADPEKAIAYLENDVELTRKCAIAMGVL